MAAGYNSTSRAINEFSYPTWLSKQRSHKITKEQNLYSKVRLQTFGFTPKLCCFLFSFFFFLKGFASNPFIKTQAPSDYSEAYFQHRELFP